MQQQLNIPVEAFGHYEIAPNMKGRNSAFNSQVITTEDRKDDSNEAPFLIPNNDTMTTQVNESNNETQMFSQPHFNQNNVHTPTAQPEQYSQPQYQYNNLELHSELQYQYNQPETATFEQKPAISSGPNPLDLLQGLKKMDSSKKSVDPFSKNKNLFDLEPVNKISPQQTINQDPNNPLNLLSGLKQMNNEKPNKKKTLFDDDMNSSMTGDYNQPKTSPKKLNNIFDDDDSSTLGKSKSKVSAKTKALFDDD